MKVIHTIQNEISKISKFGELFGDILFFSSDRYVMTQGDVYTYSFDLDEEKIINVSELYSQAKIKEIIEDLEDFELNQELDEELAEKLLDSRVLILDLANSNCFDYTQYSEYEWEIQKKQGECAKLMGYDACSATDEQGQVYMVPMFGRESELNLIDFEKR